MRLRAALLCALALLGVLPAVAGAAPAERGVLVVTGQGGTTGELVVPQTAQLGSPLPVLSGGGDYAGVLVEPVSGGAVLGAVVVRAFRDATRETVVRVGGRVQLEPGRYRVTLLGQGPTEARWALSDPSAPGLRAEPRTPTSAQFLGRVEVLAPGTAAASASVLLGRAVPAGRRVLQVGLYDGTAVEDVRMCVTTAAQCPSGLPRLGLGGPVGQAVLHAAAPAVRNLVWSTDSYHREEEGRLRAAAFVLG